MELTRPTSAKFWLA